MRFLFLFLFVGLLSSCTKKQSWQGTFYPEGCLTCDSEYVYSPSFKSFKECKSWAEAKMKNGDDKASCGRGCEYEGKMDMSKCDLVVRSWFIPLVSDSPTFSTYKE